MERRTYERLPIHVDCVIINKDSNTECKGSLCDISEGGMGFILDDIDPPKIGDRCSVQFIDSFERHTFVISEYIRVNNVAKSSKTGTRVGGVFCNKISEPCLNYIRTMSATLF